MKLVIAEKPSVAQSLAAVIGATARKDGYLEEMCIRDSCGSNPSLLALPCGRCISVSLSLFMAV